MQPVLCSFYKVLGNEKDLGREEERSLFLYKVLILFLFNSCLVQRTPNFDIGEIWCPPRHTLSLQISFSLPIKFSFSLLLNPLLPSPFPSFPKIRANYDEISEDIFFRFPLPLSLFHPPFSPLKRNRKTLELPIFQGILEI